LQQQTREDLPVDLGERIEIGERDAFVELVDRRIHWADLDHLGTDARDIAAIGRAAFARQRRRDRSHVADRLRRDIDEAPLRRQERHALRGDDECVIAAMPAQHRFETRQQ